MAYVASSDYIEYAKHLRSDTHFDEPLFTNLIARAQRFIETYTGRVFAADSDSSTVGSSDTAVTRNFDAVADVDGYYLYLDRDLCEISSITNGDSDSTTIASDQYVTEPRNDTPYYAIKLKTSSTDVWEYDSDPEDAIAVAGVWAYSLTAPNDIKHATLRLTDYFYEQRAAEGVNNDRTILTGEGLAILPQGFPKDVLAILNYYKRQRVG